MNSGTPKISGRIFPLRANVTAVVMIKPQPIARIPDFNGPLTMRPVRMRSATQLISFGERRVISATIPHPITFPIRIRNKVPNSLLFMLINPAVPVYKGDENPSNLYAVIYHIEIGYSEVASQKTKQYIIIDYKEFNLNIDEKNWRKYGK